MTTLIKIKAVDVDYFGGCPHCGSTGVVRNVGRVHWLSCDRHHVKWTIGSNLFSGWREELPAVWERRPPLALR